MALDDTAREWLQERFGKEICFDEPMARHTSLRVGGPAEAFFAPANPIALIAMIDWCRHWNVPYQIIGGGTNLLVTDAGIEGVVISLGRAFNRIAIEKRAADSVTVSALAGAKTGTLCSFALKEGLAGMNFALGVYGTIGGAIMMNAGTRYGEISEVLAAVTFLGTQSQTCRVARAQLDYRYRSLTLQTGSGVDIARPPVVIGGTFQLKPAKQADLQAEADRILTERKQNQPTQLPSAGCFFKNPSSENPAGRLIDQAGLKGLRHGDAEISDRHANFIVNRGKATAGDIFFLMDQCRTEVKARFNIELEPEIKIVGRKTNT